MRGLPLFVACIVCGSFAPATGTSSMVLKDESFDRDPGWEGFNNRVVTDLVTIQQDFGFSLTGFAGAEPGELGGHLWRSTTPAYYADRIRVRTLRDPLHASGRIVFPQASAGSNGGLFFGWFNARRQGWRPVNFLGFRLDGRGSHADIHVDYTTGTWKAGGLKTALKLRPNGMPHTWSIEYEPEARRSGMITFVLDGGGPAVLELAPGHKFENATFDRFGIFNLQVPGGPITVYLDDLRYDGKREDFTQDPRWEGVGNRVRFKDGELKGAHNYGFSDTGFAGRAKGEIGGTAWRTESGASYYGDRVGPLSLEDPLFASGKVAMTRGSSDSGVIFGWFTSAAQKNLPPGREGWKPAPFVGVIIEGPSRIGHYFRPGYASSAGSVGDDKSGPVIRPDGKPHGWTLQYDPNAKENNGAIRVTLDGESATLNLAPGHKAQGATLDRFGIFSMRPGGHHVTVYWDDLTYTAGRR